jgi:hypothetical protein
MELLSRADGWRVMAELQGAEAVVACQQAQMQMQAAHDLQEPFSSVHGDPRVANVMVRLVPGQGPEIRFIDFEVRF